MSKEERHEERIIKALKNMPDIKDSTPKNILFQRVSSRQHARSSKKRTSKLLPVFGSILAIVLIIFIPYMVINTPIETAEDNSMDQFETSVVEEYDGNPESFVQSEDIEENDSLSQDVSAEYSEEDEQDIVMKQDEYNHLVVQKGNEESKLVYVAIPDEQFQYAIPITFIVSESNNLNEHYNNLEKYLSEAGILQGDYLFKDVSFTINNEANEVDIKLPETYSIESSAQAYMFVEMLETMFVPLGVEKAVFVSDTGEGIDLGPIGTVEELQLQANEKANYKLYDNQFLIPIPLEQEATIDEAILDMEKAHEDFNISQTIPEHIDFLVDFTESALILTYTGKVQLLDNQQMVTMIEAILMTAKHYGFETVKFTEMNIPSIGNYNLTEPISTPDAVNPIVRE